MDAFAWRTQRTIKALGAQLRTQLGSHDDADLAVVEDLIVCGMCAFLPPAGREDAAGKIMALLRDMKITPDPSATGHDKVHQMFLRVAERIATSLYKDALSPHSHPFDPEPDRPDWP